MAKLAAAAILLCCAGGAVAAALNEAPLLAFPSGVLDYDPGAGPVPLDPAAQVSDSDSVDFNGGELLVTISDTCVSASTLSIVSGNGIAVFGTNLKYAFQTIGAFDYDAELGALQIVFFAAATPAIAQSVARDIVYGSNDSGPKLCTAEASISDGDGGTSPTVTKDIDIGTLIFRDGFESS